MSRDLFLRMTEKEYMEIPEPIRQGYLSSKIYSQSINDFDILMLDKDYRDAYQMHKEAKKHLEEVTFIIRERNRKNANNK